MKDYKKYFNDKLEDGSFCDGELISIANGYITEMQDIITELEKDKQYFSDSLDKQVEATLKLHKDYQELEKKNHEILKNSLDISNRFDELEEKLANADYQLEGRDLKIKELEAQIEKMKCCGNCRFSESDKLNGTFCHREGCFVVASAKCKLWEN
jgi:predicted RNase H-like nuclease (RuvC/YqgF family)